jgi:hypothetical protein
MQELIPIGFGLVLGAALGGVRPAIRLPVGAALCVALGTLATVVTGEFKVSWEYLLVDIPLVVLAAFLALVTVRHLHPGWRASHE